MGGGSTTIEQPLPGQYDNIVGNSALPSPIPADIAPFLDDDEPDSGDDQPASVKAESDSMAEIFEPESHVQPISDKGYSSRGVVADLPTDKEDVLQEVVADHDLSGGETADLANDKGDPSQGVVADLSTDEEDVSQEVVSDCDLSGGETADLASDKGDVSEGVVADAADDKGNSSEGVQGVMPGLEGHKDGICQKRWRLTPQTMKRLLGTSVLSFGSNVHELTQAVGRIDSTIKLGLKVSRIDSTIQRTMTTFNHLKS